MDPPVSLQNTAISGKKYSIHPIGFSTVLRQFWNGKPARKSNPFYAVMNKIVRKMAKKVWLRSKDTKLQAPNTK